MPAAPDYAPSLAASERRRPPQTATQKNSRRVFFSNPSGRTLDRRHLPLRTAPGYRACGYKTASGRPKWLSRDPLGEYAGINLYGYVGGDPINWVDPFGLCWGPNGPGLFDGVGQALLSNISIVGGGGYGLGLAANGEVARNLNGGSLAVDGGLGLGGAAYAGIKGVIGADRSDFTIGGVGGAGLAGGISIGFDVHHFSYLGGTINLPLPNNVTFFGGIGAGGEGKVDIQPAANIVTVNVGNGGQVSSSGILGGSSGSSGGGGGSCR